MGAGMWKCPQPGPGRGVLRSRISPSEPQTLSTVYIPPCSLAYECLGTALDPLGREIIKISLASGREIEKWEKE